jgi:protoporphyrinogen oxidase
MSAAIGHGNGAIVLEQEARPGGLVRTDPVDGYWFDRVLHLLHFRDASAEAMVHGLLGSIDFSRMSPDAWVVTAKGTARFPIQNHIGHLSSNAAVACLIGLLEA